MSDAAPKDVVAVGDPDAASVPLSPAVRKLLTILLMASVLMCALDITIANVALPHMQASLGASPESISWVLTSYILATAMMTPVTGWLGGRIGRKRLFLASLAGFTLTSALCGLAASLMLEVAARFFQGVCAAFLIPSTQAVMIDIHPKSQQVRAVTTWGLGAMVGPIMGPILGGYLTDMINWRWVYFINLPIGILATIGMLALLPKLPSPARKLDVFGFLLMAVALGSFQLMLDRGTSQGWFDSPEILIEAGCALSTLWMLVIQQRRSSHPILPAALFRDRNALSAIIFVLFVGGINTTGAALIAPMTQTLLGYPVLDAGILMVPRSIMMTVAMIAAARLIRVVDVRLIVGGGILLSAVAMWMTTAFNLEMDSHLLIVSGLILGTGLGFAMMPMNYLVGSTVAPEYRTDAAAVYSLARNVGASITLSISSAMLAHNVQVNHEELGAHITAQTMPILQPGMVEQFGLQGGRIAAMLDVEINRQAMMIAYLDDFWVLSIGLACVIPVVFMLRPARAVKGSEATVGDGH